MQANRLSKALERIRFEELPLFILLGSQAASDCLRETKGKKKKEKKFQK